MDEVIRMRDVYVAYNGTMVLENVNLSVFSNNFLGIVGPNGGGKTTLLKVMLGFKKPVHGQVFFLGSPPEKNSRYIGYVPQHLNFDRDFPISVWEVAMTGRLSHVGLFKRYSDYDKEVTARALEKVGMFELRDRQIGKLSGGEIQRVLIARALVTEPKILLFDEPAAGIDSKSEMNLYELLSGLNEEIPVVLVSHNLGVIFHYVNKVVCLNRRVYCNTDPTGVSLEMLEAAYGCPLDFMVPDNFIPALNKCQEKTVN